MHPGDCKTCGQLVLWAIKRDSKDGKYNPPLDPLSEVQGFILLDGMVHYGPSYQLHKCPVGSQEKLEQLQREQEEARKAKWREYKAKEQAKQDAKDAVRLTAHQAVADAFACDRCGVVVGQLCINLMENAKGNYKTNKNAHPERQELFDAKQADPRLAERNK